MSIKIKNIIKVLQVIEKYDGNICADKDILYIGTGKSLTEEDHNTVLECGFIANKGYEKTSYYYSIKAYC